jgi:hypothetical protein
MKKLFFVLAIVFLCARPAAAQFTQVSGTVTDVNGIPYACAGATITAQIVNNNGQSLYLSGQQFSPQPASTKLGCPTDPSSPSTPGAFAVQLADNAQIRCGSGPNIVTCAQQTQWLFTVNTTGIAPPMGTGPQTCSATLTISGASQSVSASFAACPALSRGGGGGGASGGSIVTNGLIGQYQILPTETPAGLIDYSGRGNNATGTQGTAPVIANTSGGIFCLGSGGVLLPAALNSALTVHLFVTFNNGAQSGNANTVAAFVSGNGGGSPGNAIAYSMQTNWQFAPTFGAYLIGDQAANTLKSQALESFNGTGDLAWTLSTTDHMYINGQEVTRYIFNGPSAGLQTTGQYELCGTPAGSGFGNATFTGSSTIIWSALFYNRVLSPIEIAQNHVALTNALAARGVNASVSSSSNSDSYVAFGDSISNNTAVNPAYPNIINLTNAPNVRTYGITAETMAHFAAMAPIVSESFYRPAAAKNVATVFLGTNDNCVPSASAIFTNLVAFTTTLRLFGFHVIPITMISRSGEDTCKNAYDALIRNQEAFFFDGIIDPASDPLIGADGQGAIPFVFPDGIHPSQAVHYNALAFPIQRGINGSVNGNKDFSSATVYTSPAAVATATTTVTQSGNTVTVTFGATPANCNVGNSIQISGVTAGSGTATGYNSTAANGAGASGWYILTRSATQITYFDGTTGLGAASVQGTGVCPQQQDTDVYSTLNFGAGNFTLQSCVGLTGQNRYIKNINAASSTIVPNSTETIDGAANLAIASKATVILQSILTSASAGGCSWRQLQNN